MTPFETASLWAAYGHIAVAAAIGLGAVLMLVTFGHLLAEPLYAFNTHVIPRALLLIVVLAMFDEDRLSLDSWLTWRREAASAAS